MGWISEVLSTADFSLAKEWLKGSVVAAANDVLK